MATRGPSNPRGHAARTNPSTIAGIVGGAQLTGGAPKNPGVHSGNETVPNPMARVDGTVPLTGLKGTTPRDVVAATIAATMTAASQSPGLDPLSGPSKMPVDDLRK